MAGRAQPPKDIKSETLHVVKTDVNEQRGTKVVIRVVDWTVNGKHYPQLEKREFFNDNEGEEKMGKAKGFSRKDMELVQDQWGEIMTALGGKPNAQGAPAPAATTATAPAPAGADSDF